MDNAHLSVPLKDRTFLPMLNGIRCKHIVVNYYNRDQQNNCKRYQPVTERDLQNPAEQLLTDAKKVTVNGEVAIMAEKDQGNHKSLFGKHLATSSSTRSHDKPDSYEEKVSVRRIMDQAVDESPELNQKDAKIPKSM